MRGHDKNSAIMVQVETHLIAQIMRPKPGLVNAFCCCVAMFLSKVLGGYGFDDSAEDEIISR